MMLQDESADDLCTLFQEPAIFFSEGASLVAINVDFADDPAAGTNRDHNF